jgi:hypothetical protein
MDFTDETVYIVRRVSCAWNDVGKVTAQLLEAYYNTPDGKLHKATEIRTVSTVDGRATLEAVYKP